MFVTGGQQENVVPSARAERRRIRRDDRGVFVYALVAVALCLAILAVVFLARV